jgi:hypothetical protein
MYVVKVFYTVTVRIPTNPVFECSILAGTGYLNTIGKPDIYIFWRFLCLITALSVVGGASPLSAIPILKQGQIFGIIEYHKDRKAEIFRSLVTGRIKIKP